MGEKYALIQGEKPAVAQAIREHYMPISAEGELPQSKIGAVLAIADKLDSLLAFFGVASAEAAKDLGIAIGDMVTPHTMFREMNDPDFLLGKAWDDRVCVAACIC